MKEEALGGLIGKDTIIKKVIAFFPKVKSGPAGVVLRFLNLSKA